jgi:hypothetical protein
MKMSSLIIVPLGLSIAGAVVAQGQQPTNGATLTNSIEYEQKPLPPLPNSISGTETVDTRAFAFLKREGFSPKFGEHALPDGRTAIVHLGKAAIAVGPGNPNFVQARVNAYYKALVDAKMKCAEFQETVIESELVSDMSEPGEQRAAADARRMEREGLAKEGVVQVARALNSDMKSANAPAAFQTAGVYVEKVLDNKVREQLAARGIDPNKPVSEQTLKPILSTSSFKNRARAVAAERCTGVKVLASFEQNPANGQGSVGVLTIYTRLLHEIADAIVSGNYQLIPPVKPGQPIEQHIPADTRTKLATFGTQLVRNERGEYVLLSFGQAQPATTSQQSKDIAYRKARLAAQSQLRLFLGAEVHSHNQKADGEETIEREGGDIQAKFDSAFSGPVEVVAAALPIRGLQEVDSWETLHPASNSPVVGVVMGWKVSSAQLAGAVKQLNASSRSIAQDTARRGLPNASSQQGDAFRTQSAQPGPERQPARTANPNSAEGGVRTRDF